MSTFHSNRTSADSPLSNGDLAPTEADRRTWGTYDFAALWIGLSIVTKTYWYSRGGVFVAFGLAAVSYFVMAQTVSQEATAPALAE